MNVRRDNITRNEYHPATERLSERENSLERRAYHVTPLTRVPNNTQYYLIKAAGQISPYRAGGRPRELTSSASVGGRNRQTHLHRNEPIPLK